MKNRFESREVFGKYAELEAIDYMIRQESNRLTSAAPKAIIDVLIDEATGAGVARDLDSIDRVKALLDQKIQCEKFLEIDSANAQQLLIKLNELENNLKADIARIPSSMERFS